MEFVFITLLFLPFSWASANLSASLSTYYDSPFRVKSLFDSPNLPNSWSGLIPVPGADEGNSLFFWLLETQDSLYDDNLISMFTLRIFLTRKKGEKGID